jgi:osmotically-inducible protein OsmY
VDTSNGIVILRGHVASDYEREQAISIARDIKGVKTVKSELTSS